MRTVLRTAVLVLLVSAGASQASAGDKVWSVAGVINNGLATVFTCTNGGTASALVKVDVFNKAGALDVTGTANAAAGATVNLATKPVNTLPGGVDVDMGASTMHSGSARITAPSGVFCTAFVIDPAGTPAVVAFQLNIIKKTNQKGD